MKDYKIKRYGRDRRRQKTAATAKVVLMVALIAAAGLSILNTVAFEGQAFALNNVRWVGLGLFAIAFVVLRKWKCNPILLMVLCGVAGMGLDLLLCM